METKSYVMTLASGTVISGLRLNGNNYISREQLSPETFSEDAMLEVRISDGQREEVIQNAKLENLTMWGDETWIIIRQKTAEELAAEKLAATIDYIAVMAGVDLDE